jgi:hypothetical protein
VRGKIDICPHRSCFRVVGQPQAEVAVDVQLVFRLGVPQAVTMSPTSSTIATISSSLRRSPVSVTFAGLPCRVLTRMALLDLRRLINLGLTRRDGRWAIT